MKDIYNDIIQMHEKFGISGINEKPRRLSEEEKRFRAIAMAEEWTEYTSAEALDEEIDAIIDLVVFALGTLERMGVDFYAHWNLVMAANMAKELCNDSEKSKRGFKLDLCKPEGWVPPNHKIILERNIK